MAKLKRDAEYSLPLPEDPAPAREFRADPELEYTPLPPEYGQRTAPEPEAKKKRGLRKLLAAPAVLLLSFVVAQAGSIAPAKPTPDTPTEPGYVTPLTVDAELPRGSVMIDINDYYTGVEGDTLNYRYMLYNSAVEENSLSDLPWPITVTADVIDADGKTVASPENPDIWTMGRSLDEHAINVTRLRGDLILRLRAEYEQDGEQRQTTVFTPFARDPGDCFFMIDYAMLDPSDRRVTFDYWVNRDGSTEMIVPVEATLIDSQGRMAHPPVNPVMWSSDPDLDPDCKWADATDLNDDLTLILRTEYTGKDGKKHSSLAVRQVVIIGRSTEFEDPKLETAAAITSLSRTSVSYTAAFRTTYESGSYYDMTVNGTSLVWLDHNGNELRRTGLDYETASGEKTFDRSKSPPWGEWPDWTFTGSGEHRFYDASSGGYSADAVEKAKTVYAEIILINRYTGRRYTIQSAPVPVPEDNYPLGDGEIVLTVYYDTPQGDFPSFLTADQNGVGILMQKSFPESGFSGYSLSATAVPPSGYTFGGWVIHVGNPFDEGAAADPFKEYNGDPPVDALITQDSFAFPVDYIGREEVEKVPPSADGKRYVNVHACWIRQNPGESLLLLDDGNGSVTGYSMDVPLASEGFLYLCRYPIPDNPGKTFDGWYDKDGRRVDMLSCFFSFTPVKYDSEGKFTGYDWEKGQEPVTLYAHWK